VYVMLKTSPSSGAIATPECPRFAPHYQKHVAELPREKTVTATSTK